MIRDILELNDFIVLVETTDANESEIAKCYLDEDTIGISFYGSGKVDLEVVFGGQKIIMQNQKGIAFSFFGNNKVSFSHQIAPSEPLLNVSVFSTVQNLQKMASHEKELYGNHLKALTDANKDFETGPVIHMSPDMYSAVNKIFNTTYQGASRLLFLKSQVTELLSHYFAQISSKNAPVLKSEENKKVQMAKDIITQNVASPPSLNELSKLIGLNSNKLKKNFKQLFGVPVFKYIQQERLRKAHQLLELREMTVQEVAWHVGYESVSSFSNAFLKEYGFRPNNILK